MSEQHFAADADLDTAHDGNSLKLMTAADFETYAPKALAIADMHGEGVATRDELAHMVANPAPSEDPKMKQTMELLLRNYDFLTALSDPVKVVYGQEKDLMGWEHDKALTKYGITPKGIEKIGDVLEGRSAITYQDYGSPFRLSEHPNAFGAGLLAGLAGTLVGCVGGEIIGDSTFFFFGTGCAIGAGILGPIAATAGAKYGRNIDAQKFSQSLPKANHEFESFIDEIALSKPVRAEILPP